MVLASPWERVRKGTLGRRPATRRATEVNAAVVRATLCVMTAHLTFFGHSTVAIDLDGVRVVTDPVLRRQVGPLYRRGTLPSCEGLADPQVILLSHLHLDHFDPPTLRLFRTDTPILAPVGSRLSLRWRRFSAVHELSPGESRRVGAVEIVATEAQHQGTRFPTSVPTPSLGFVISGNRSIYFPGDTGLFPGMQGLWPALDVALLPIAGLGPRLPEAKHLGPADAVRAMELLRPRLTVPIHWGAYHLPGTALMRLGNDPHRDAPQEFARRARALEPDLRVAMLQPGESIDLDQALAHAAAGHATPSASGASLVGRFPRVTQGG